MQAKVAKQFTFHAAHRLPNHDGQCRRLHGHSYVLEVAVIGDVKLGKGTLPDEGMVLDFTVLKDIYKMEIEPFVEHQTLTETLANPSSGFETYCTDEDDKRIPLTTCECLARWMHKVVTHRLRDVNPDLKVKIKLWETPTSFAVVG